MPGVRLRDTIDLVFDDGDPVRAASAVAPLGDGWLIAQDDGTIAAWWCGRSIVAVRLLPPVDGHDTFRESDGTKALKPDLEAACRVPGSDAPGVLLLGSGSHANRMRGVLVHEGQPCWVATADLSPLYAHVAQVLGLSLGQLNLEGACVIGEALRWFQRGHGASGVASSSVDLPLAAVTAAVMGDSDPSGVVAGEVRQYEFASSGDVSLAITDATALADGRVLVSAAAEDTPDAVADGEVVGSALALLDDDHVVATVPLPTASDGTVWKVEGLVVTAESTHRLDVLAVVDQDDPDRPSLALALEVDLL